MAGLIETVRSGRTYNPRTFLGFYATVLGIGLAACLSASGVLAFTGKAGQLIPWILGFGALMFVLLVGGVFAVMLVNPSKVMLTQVSGSEFVEIQRATLGDSKTGKRIEARTQDEVVVLVEGQSVIGAGTENAPAESEDDDG